MMKIELVQSLAFSAPMIISLICCVLLLLYLHNNALSAQRKLIILMILTSAVAFFCWVGVVLYIINYKAFVWFNTFFFFCLLLDQVLLYHFMFIITGTGYKRNFYAIHYIIPVVLAVVMGVWSLMTPYEVQYYIVESRGENAPGYLWYSRFFSSTVPMLIVYNVVYPLAGFYRVRAYRREVVNYSADEYPASLGWFYRLIFLLLLTLPLASATLIVHKSVLLSSVFSIAGILLPIIQYLVICYNLISGNFVIIEPHTPTEGISAAKYSLLDRKRFERYMREEKPYLNPKLKITEVAFGLCTNRSYVSTFINKEYGMNFSRYINLCRLRELDKLRISPENACYTNMELVLMAGFSCYRSYIRVREYEEKLRLPMVLE